MRLLYITGHARKKVVVWNKPAGLGGPGCKKCWPVPSLL